MINTIYIGAGASGLLASAENAKLGNNVTLIEKMNRVGRKLMITGKGRCNITNATFEVEQLISNVTRNKRFLYSAFNSFMPYDTIALFEELGVPTKIERGERVFPVSDKAVDVVDALEKYARQSGVKFVCGTVKSFELEDNHITNVILEDGSRLPCDRVAICTGGKSYPNTGSTGDGYILSRSVGHNVTQLTPSLVPLEASNNFIPSLMGLSLKNVSIRLMKNKKEIYSDFGEMIFTHFGVSGPIILSASCHIDTFFDNEYKIFIDLKSSLDEKTLDKRILRDFSEEQNRDFINSLSKLLPKKIIPIIVRLSGIEPSRKVNQITKEERQRLVYILKNFEINITSFRPIEEAIITSGGVDVKEIDPKTMKSKIIDNLYFAGEVIDVDAYTGGFNLQIAFSTGYLCAKNMI